MLPDPLDTLTPADLPNDNLVDVELKCGLAVVSSLLKHLPGQHFLVPQNGLARVQAAAARAGRIVGPFLAEDMPTPTWNFIASNCGIEVALSLLEHAGNILIIIPKNPFKKLFHRYINEHYDGSNVMELSIRIGLSRSHFYTLLNEPDPYKKRRPRGFVDPMQTSLV